MKRLNVTEDDAYRLLRKLASDSNIKVADVARTVLAADEVYIRLEHI
jgi:AmiR/NasT family two-component response regulator